MDKLQSERLRHLPNVDALLKISLGLILFTIISTALIFAETMPVDVDGTSYDVEYYAEQVSVTGMIAEYEPNSDYAGLIIAVDVTGSPGTLELILDRSFMDSMFDGVDDEYFVLVDGFEPNFTETKNTQSRTLNIEVPFGTEDVEIIGTVFGNDISTPVEEPMEETPVEETPVEETPVEETPVEETPVEETPVEETPVEETPVEETPVEETPVEETPVEETPVEETPVEETPVVDTPKTQCGPGTVLKNGACVLDERCGPGTVLKNGACVIDSTSKLSSPSVKEMGKDMVMGFAVAFAAAGIVGVILGIVSKASKSN